MLSLPPTDNTQPSLPSIATPNCEPRDRASDCARVHKVSQVKLAALGTILSLLLLNCGEPPTDVPAPKPQAHAPTKPLFTVTPSTADTILEITPGPKTDKDLQPITVPIRLDVVNSVTHERLYNQTVQVTSDAVPLSGFHNHPDDTHPALRPTGEFVTVGGTSPVTECNTGPTGEDCIVTWIDPQVSGVYKWTFTGPGCCKPDHAFIIVRFPGLEDFPGTSETLGCGGACILRGQTTTHEKNHFALPNTIAKVTAIAHDFTLKFPDQPILVNDISLPWGGLFDIDANWESSPNGHNTHRCGEQVDFNFREWLDNPLPPPPDETVDPRSSSKFNWLYYLSTQKYGGLPFLREVIASDGPHLHVTFFSLSGNDREACSGEKAEIRVR